MTPPLSSAEAFDLALWEELAVLFPGEVPPSFQAASRPNEDARARSFRWVDLVVRQVAPEALRASGFPAAAAEVEGLGVLSDAEAARQTMMALEKIGRRHHAPSAFMRALGGAPSTLLLWSHPRPADEEREERARFQILVAGVRLLGMAAGLGVPRATLWALVAPFFAPTKP